MFSLHLIGKELWLEGGQWTPQVWPKDRECTTDYDVTVCICVWWKFKSLIYGKPEKWKHDLQERCAMSIDEVWGQSMKCEVIWWGVRSIDEAWGQAMRCEADWWDVSSIDEVWGEALRCEGQLRRCEVDRWGVRATDWVWSRSMKCEVEWCYERTSYGWYEWL